MSRVTNSFAKIRIVDFPGSRDFHLEIDENCYGKSVDNGGLGIGGSHANLAVIYVIDAQVNLSSFKNNWLYLWLL